MWRLTLAQMRRSAGRLAAAGIAIAIGTAFVAATLLSGVLIQRVAYDSITASYGKADLIAAPGSSVTEAQIEALRDEPGVAAADPRIVAPSVDLSAGGRSLTQAFTPVPSDSRLDTQHLAAGENPSGPDEVTLPERTAERLRVGVGDTVDVQAYVWVGGDDGHVEPAADRVTVVGLTTDPGSAWPEYGGVGQAGTADVLRWSTGVPEATLADTSVSSILIVVADGADVATTQDAVADVLRSADGGSDPLVLTRDAAAERAISGEGTGAITVVVLAFAAVALLVAGLVIANTFQVLVAQRTRTLALLRCVGASRGQVRRSVLLEAGVLGLVSSLVGIVGGTLLVQVALWVLKGADLPFAVPSRVTPTPASILVPLAVGVAVTVAAALTPARVATRVRPIAALRPADAPNAGSRAGRVRLVLSLILLVGGAAGLGGGVALATSADILAAVGIAILGGAASFIGLLLSAVFWMPRLVAAVGRLAGRSGVSARLAAANTGRNPARTAATSTALLIGVTLVAMMSTGAVTARSTLDGELDSRYPVDLEIVAQDTLAADGTSTPGVLPAATIAKVRDLPGVQEVVELPQERLSVGDGITLSALGLSAQDAGALMRDPQIAADVTDGALVVGQDLAEDLGLADGDTLPVTLADPVTGEPTGSTRTDLTVAVSRLGGVKALVTPSTLDALGATAADNTAWLRLSDVNSSGDVVQDIRDTTVDSAVEVTGAAVERSTYQQAIDVMLAVVVGLLAVAVVIALIGVTNTLSLSVIERRRESATLRAIGLTRRQLRATMAIEGVLIAGIGAVTGVLLGLLYGWAGSAAVLTQVGAVELRVPWLDLGLVLLVALVAGMLASVLPGRSAARTPPVAALAVD